MGPIKQSLASHFLGAGAALASALCWAFSAIVFRRIGERMSAAAMNFSKGAIALVFFAALANYTSIAGSDVPTLLVLCLSGLVGICLADTFYFLTLIRLGPRNTLLLDPLIPASTALFAMLLFGEKLPWLGLAGIGMTVASVVYVMYVQIPPHKHVRTWQTGLLFGILFVGFNVVGILLSKLGVSRLSSMDASFIRQLSAFIGLGLWGGANARLYHWIRPVTEHDIRWRLLLAAFVGAFLGTWLSIAALKYTYASVAASFNATAPLFVIPLTVILMKEKFNARALPGVIVAVAGIVVYFLSLAQTPGVSP